MPAEAEMADADAGPEIAGDSIELPVEAEYWTEGGRPVFGGGGINPDVSVPDTLTAREREFAEALGRGSFSLNQLAVRFAANWNADHANLQADFEVSQQMRDEFYGMLVAEEVEVDPALYGDVQPLVDRFLAAQLANSAFGEAERLRRSQAGNPQVRQAVQLLREAETPEDLLSVATRVETGAGETALLPAAAPSY
jgi:carboxyl-terminal processing protease